MREPPKLTNAQIKQALKEHYGLSATGLTFLPLGNDSATSAYRVQAASGATYFLKARAKTGFSLPSLLVPRHVHDQGIKHIILPLPTVTDTLWAYVGDFAISLSPFVEGRIGAESGLTDLRWRALARWSGGSIRMRSHHT
jgi:spectinomycin phosphotransferase